MAFQRKVTHEAGVSNPKLINRPFITGFENPQMNAPKGNYSISETTNLTFTAGVVKGVNILPDLRLKGNG